MGCQLLLAGRAEHLFLTIQFIESIRFEHDAFLVTAVFKTEKVPDFMGAFFSDTVNEIVIVPIPPVILIPQPGGGDNRGAGSLAGKPEDKTVAVLEKVLVHHQQDGFLQGMAVLIHVDALQQRLRIDLPALVHISHDTHMVLRNRCRNTNNCRDRAGDRHLEPGRGEGIPKNMDMHRYILLEWVPINILRRVSGSISRNTIRSAVEVGIGRNTTAAQIVHDAGVHVRCTDIRDMEVPAWLSFQG